MSRKTIYKKVKFTLEFDGDYDDDAGYRGFDLREKIEDIIDSTKDKYKDYKLVKLISVIDPEDTLPDRWEYDYPFKEFQEDSFYNKFENEVWFGSDLVAKIGFVFEK